MRELETGKSPYSNSLINWHERISFTKTVFNFLCIHAQRYVPSLRMKRMLLRLTGMKVGKDVAIGLMAMFDVFVPELIEIGDNCVIGYNSTILAHEFLIREYRIGKVVVGENTLIGANSTVLPGVRIGKNAIVSAMTLVNANVPDNSFVGGVPAKIIKRN